MRRKKGKGGTNQDSDNDFMCLPSHNNNDDRDIATTCIK
jgi:hypothetical protein